MSAPATIVPASSDFASSHFINPKNLETLTSSIVAFEVANGEAKPVMWPTISKGFEPVIFTGAQYIFGGCSASSLQGLASAIREAARHG
jgi:hypothetical protein